jgi:polyisoprenoid-binding protein YceI
VKSTFNKIFYIFSMSLFLFHSGQAQAEPRSASIDLDKGTGAVEFHATGHPSALKIVGKGSAPRGKFNIEGTEVTGTASFDLDSLDTGIETRNHHMKEKYLETGKFHDARLTLKKMVVPADLISKKNFSLDQIPFTGILALHGVEKPVSGIAKIDRDDGTAKFIAEFGLKVSDYAIAVPKFAGITMADDVVVTVVGAAPFK